MSNGDHITSYFLETLERAEKAEARVEDLEKLNETLDSLMKSGERRGVDKGSAERVELEARVKELESAIFDVLCGEETEVVKKLILNQGCDEVACQYLHTCDHCPIVTTEMENS
jgi:hypothetical protein